MLYQQAEEKSLTQAIIFISEPVVDDERQGGDNGSATAFDGLAEYQSDAIEYHYSWVRPSLLKRRPSSGNQSANRLFLCRLWLSLFISSIEVTIVSTALFKISDDLNALTQSHWVVVAYLFTYNGEMKSFFSLTIRCVSTRFSMIFPLLSLMFAGVMVACSDLGRGHSLIVDSLPPHHGQAV